MMVWLCHVCSYYGDYCEFYNPCWSSPCLHGATCLNLVVGSFRCQCRTGYYTQHVNVSRTDWSADQNFGLCLGLNGLGWASISVSKIQSQSWFVSRWLGLLLLLWTQCRTGYYGSTCENIDGCASSPCQNGASCSSASRLSCCTQSWTLQEEQQQHTSYAVLHNSVRQ